MSMLPSLARRRVLHAAICAPLLAAASDGLAAVPQTDQAISTLYARVRGSTTAQPTYWLTRGIKYAQNGTDMTPLHGFVMVESLVFDRQSDGSVISRTLEGGYGVDNDGATRLDTFLNPISRARVPVAAIPPMIVTYRTATDGVLSIPGDDPRRAQNAFSGSVASRSAPAGESWVEESFLSKTLGNTPTALREVITYRGIMGSLDKRSDGLRTASKTVIAIRSWPYADAPPGLVLTAVYEGQKYASLKALLADAQPQVLEATYPGFIDRLAAFR
jgi:hypothetical protein